MEEDGNSKHLGEERQEKGGRKPALFPSLALT